MHKSIPDSRLSRLSQMGQLAGGIAGSMVSEGARQIVRGKRPGISDLLLTPGNMKRIADRLAQMRGAAMKLGQLISMDNGHLIPPQLSELLARLRDNAYAMPMLQLAQVLESNWGSGWEKEFSRFHFTPIAAASIGQVHKADLKNGRRLAIKIQYPGVKRSIDSDVDNVGTVLNLFNLLPQGLDVGVFLSEAKKQLHQEADYLHEAQAIQRFQKQLLGDRRIVIPSVTEELTTTEVLAMEYLDGEPIESLAEMAKPLRNQTANILLEIALKEVFDWGIVQTDPNFSNYLFHAKSGRIQLLDFGAVRSYETHLRKALLQLFHACIEGQDGDIIHAAEAVGYLGDGDPVDYQNSVIQLLRFATEPARCSSVYDFANSDLPQRMAEVVLEIRLKNRYNRLPPMDILFLHRKLAGLYLLFSRLEARIDVRDIAKTHQI
ncbi:MAG: AarF/ABC1/UbiB kinase family protein [Candidatus Thiodiazotropha sp. (ex Ctena orbiculata)]|uniref:AarF/ABC1/UbiB kinase family protein n=1 Tax=Candidatus Thiodiazotropha taylori TaxID=2792791 RepID=A0A944MCC8_9GAMM|nr:AarF/ABC1/UbiB kinase family protein [Candidatus Thiodiazotropha taylori]PUB90305.1 MAG: ubiquinol-cytochrome C reductase [gamma proteobacterium symbiont of Ctena orbiculata]MBT2988812.1 AarF/ABC1/UbiB kinase family protein [Candidatus Thiodiazotropha taylori]MBT2998335.1 AarF/ABC1/UbiB kinase family protein [Candidatus Thiodiazotropha taylori]MBT3002554.1 AarF/ABC1/UbiB kinase family protein [Candidatus Thiodiazotropha taylori]